MEVYINLRILIQFGRSKINQIYSFFKIGSRLTDISGSHVVRFDVSMYDGLIVDCFHSCNQPASELNNHIKWCMSSRILFSYLVQIWAQTIHNKGPVNRSVRSNPVYMWHKARIIECQIPVVFHI